MSERYLCSRRLRRLKPQNEQEPKTVEHQRCERCQTEAASNVSAKKHFQSIISKRVEYQRQIPLAVIPNSILKFIGSNSKREKAVKHPLSRYYTKAREEEEERGNKERKHRHRKQ